MPVKGLSEQLRLPRLGKIRLGEKQLSKKTGRERPVALDYFVVPDEIKEVYGEKPRKLDVMLPMESRDIFFPQWFKRYGSSKGLKCKGDGEQATEINEETGEMTEIECPGKACQYFEDLSCKTIGNLQVVLYKVPGLGIYQIDTSSYNSIVNINSGIEMVRSMLRHKVKKQLMDAGIWDEEKYRAWPGSISWVPLVLKVEMQEAHPRVNGSRIKTVIPVMSLTADVSVEEIMEGVKKGTVKLPGPEKQVVIDNADVDEKEPLLYPGRDGILESKEKDEATKETKEPTKKEIPKEEPAQEERGEGELFPARKERPARNRNQLNITWHKVKKRLMSAGVWDDEKYLAWLKLQFDVESEKDLSNEQLSKGIEIMSDLWNEQLKKEK